MGALFYLPPFYRLDPTGRGKGECELLSVPLSHLDIGRDVYPDPDYDYFERDRNAASINCKQRPSGSYGGSGGGGGTLYGGGYSYGYGGGGSYYPDRRYDYGGNKYNFFYFKPSHLNNNNNTAFV